MKLKSLSLSLCVGLLVFAISGAMLPLEAKAVTPSSILVRVMPENPVPGENVNITLSSYASNLDVVSIGWSINGKNVSSEVGKKTFSLSAPAAGQETTVVATVALPDGKIEKTIKIRPAITTLLWQATDSYVPPFYKGKALPASGSKVKIVAMPEIKIGSQLANPKNMNYVWRKDYTNNPDGSGYGKNSFSYITDYLEDENNVSVTASTLDQKYSSSASINIKTFEPKIIFYKNDLNLGTLWEQALLNGHKIVGDEIIEAAPYFISPRDPKNPFLTWDWYINNKVVEVSYADRNLLPLKIETGTSGTSKIKLEINNIYKIFMTTNEELSVEF